MTNTTAKPRDVVFLSKATPGDNEFALWLAPRLEAAGYKVFCDILALQPGDRWRSEVTGTLQERAIKMLLCCRDATLRADGVLEEIEIAKDLTKTLQDPKFIIPLRLEPFNKLFGIGQLQWVNFETGWAPALERLLDALRRQHVPRSKDPQINPDWELFRRRNAIAIKREPERLTSNWLRIARAPDAIRYYEPSGAYERRALEAVAAGAPYPIEIRPLGLLTFASPDEVAATFENVGRLKMVHECKLMDFVEKGAEKELQIKGQDASNIIVSMFRQAWILFARERGLLQYDYSGAIGFHVSKDLAKVGQRISWGRQGENRSSMLRNSAKGAVWQFGVTATPSFFPFPHFRLKSRVLFAPPDGDDAGPAFDDKRKQHRLRRSVCKGWRNKQWHGRLLAFLELLSGDTSYFHLPLSPSAQLGVEAAPLLFTSPVSTVLPDTDAEDDEEGDDSTLGRPEPDPEDEE
jgi:hypothetical protein